MPAPLRPTLALVVALAAALPVIAVRAQDAQTVANCVAGFATVSPSERYACNSVDLMARLPHSTWGASAGAEIWGWTDPQTGHEYALVGASNGTAFVDVTVPSAPVYVGRLPQPSGVSTSSWRTLRVYSDHVFVGSEASNHGVQVFNLNRLRTATPPTTFTADARYTGTSNTHTLAINEATGFLYIAGGTNSNTANCDGGGLHMVNIQTPTAPVFAGCYDNDGYTHETHCQIYNGPDATYVGREICVAYNQNHISFVDVTNKSAPTLIASGFYPNTGYTHQGWFTPDWRYLLINDEEDSASPGTRTVVMDVSDLNAPTFRFNYNGPLHTYAHNLYIIGRYAFLSNYRGGMHILDITNIASNQFTEVAMFDTYRQDAAAGSLGYNGMWMNYPYFASGTIVANDIENGLFVLDPTGIVVAGEPGPVPASGFRLSAPAPNPTGASSRLTLGVAEGQRVRAEVYDALGRRVAVVFDGAVADGSSTALVFEASSLPAGPYLLRVVGETFATTARLSVAH